MKPRDVEEYVARYRKPDGTPQCLRDHLEGTSSLASVASAKIGLPSFGALMGLLHDFGKFSPQFQAYLRSARGKIEPDDEDYIESSKARGKIDHSTAGAQYVWKHRRRSPSGQLAAEMIALCLVSHHSGLIDCLAPDGTDVFNKRITKPMEQTHLAEVELRLEEAIRERARILMESPDLESELANRLTHMRTLTQSLETGQFMLGFLVRFLFSTLIDADRLNSAERAPNREAKWQPLIELIERKIIEFSVINRIDEIRAEISTSCLRFAGREKGLFLLTVPTGGGKTLASLRFALHHAAKHGMARVVYVVPYTSIIDQNAGVARSVFAPLEEGGRCVVLEHHSNLTPERDTYQSKLLSENWDVPVVYTTAVQLLETLFGGGTRGVRRLHQLANAVIIFDEVQTTPIRTVHMFNNAVNFLVSQCGSTVVFCTATQPLLDKVEVEKGAARLSEMPEMMPDVQELFRSLHRVRIDNECKDGGWSDDEVMEAVMRELDDSGSVLIIVNKKSQARELYRRLKGKTEHVYHLSTSMCPAHRMTVLDGVKSCLDPRHPVSVICVSTQLIEAGVDVDFGSVIRYLAGMDSIAQAAGRCNRNGLRKHGRLLIVNPANENLDKLPEIKTAQDVTLRVLREFHDDPALFEHDLQNPKVMELYYSYYFFQRAHEMSFPVSAKDLKELPRNDDLLTMLSSNIHSVQIYQNEQKQAPQSLLRHSFMSAAKAFKAIDSPAQGVVVPYGEGERIIAGLAGSDSEARSRLLKEAQRYSVNLFPHEMSSLKGRLYEAWAGSGIYTLDQRHYSMEFGASTEEVAEMKVLIT